MAEGPAEDDAGDGQLILTVDEIRSKECPMTSPDSNTAAVYVEKSTASGWFRFFAASALALAFLWAVPRSFAQSAGEKTFASPGDAALALYTAAKVQDNQALASIFGSNANTILHTGDDVADKNGVANFVRRYDEMRRVVIEPDQTASLYIGADNWPLPIPIEKNASGSWYFNTEAGMKEILYRRIGRNENDAIEILEELVRAQQEYASASRDAAPAGTYASFFVSSEGKQDGLYWKTAENEPPSPIGPVLAFANGQGYNIKQGEAAPFHGYFYRILTKQGASAKGGALDYLSGSKLARGFAFLAYPAEYGNSGVKTFMVNKDGIVYQSDLGNKTMELAAAIEAYNPDSAWEKAD